MLQKMNYYLEKALPFMTPASVIIGILLSKYFVNYTFLVPWIFALITFNGSLKSNFKSLKQVIAHPLPMLITLFILHIIMPIWAFSLGHLIFPGDIFTITGLVLAVVIPTGVTSMIWVSIYSGNTVLALAIIIIDTILSPFIVPFQHQHLYWKFNRHRYMVDDERAYYDDCYPIHYCNGVKPSNERKSSNCLDASFSTFR